MTITADPKLDVHPIAGYIGAEIDGVDLSDELDDNTISDIRAALLRHRVIFFRNQSIGHAEQVAFTRRFGELTAAHPYEDEPPEGFPEILPVDSRVYSRKFGLKRFSYDNQWHTDVTAAVNPPAATILRAVTVPERGGDTTWTNLVAAYEGLSEPLRALADGLRARHHFGAARKQEWTEQSDYARRIRKSPFVSIHPVVRVHPETGERALFVTPGFTSQIVDVSQSESDHLLDLFFQQITRPQYTVRFRWTAGSVAFWDNRATAHLAPNDLDGYNGDRVLYRTTIVGDIPVGPDGKESESVLGDRLGAQPR
jgi:alpha-ketoglutarate-dependent taurine dioxygenase